LEIGHCGVAHDRAQAKFRGQALSSVPEGRLSFRKIMGGFLVARNHCASRRPPFGNEIRTSNFSLVRSQGMALDIACSGSIRRYHQLQETPMRVLTHGFIIILIGFLPASCGRAGSPAAGPATGDRDLLTYEEISAGGYNDMYTALLAMRPHWLRTRGRDSFRAPGQVQVYRDDRWLGGVETLRYITVSGIGSVRYYDGLEASGRWGMGHGQGVVHLSTRMR
jgi:hypothetical protein